MTPERSNVIPVFDGPLSGTKGRFLGAILIDAGKLTLEEAERVLNVQREQGLRFGDAALKLGLITEADLQLALAHQFDYPYLVPGDSEISPDVVAAYQPFSDQVEALRALRSQLTLRWFGVEEGGRALSVVSPSRGEGRSYMAANLAVLFSQLGQRTLLIDADLRSPRQHEFFKLDNRSGLSAVLSGRGDAESIQRVPSFRDLSVLPAGAIPPNPQELLTRPLFQRLLSEMANEFSVIIVDTPARERYADAQAACLATGAALMLVRKDHTRINTVKSFVNELASARIRVLGTVMNEF